MLRFFRNAGGDKAIADTISHEAGHTLGLGHDGTKASGYYGGHPGVNAPGWAPIMGAGFYQPVVQWSKGEYPDANNTEDDLAIITRPENGVGYRPDDVGDTITSANALNIIGNRATYKGIIERTDDVDVFKFYSGAGKISFKADPFLPAPNLDILAELLDSDGNVLASDNPSTTNVASMSATINYTLTNPGTYYLRVSGVGAGDLATGYSDYGSIGQYWINGAIVGSPILGNLESAPATFNRGDDSASLTSQITVEDDGNLSGATVSIIGFRPEDRLTYAQVGLINGSYDSAAGKLTLSGSGTPEQYQAALRAIRYQNTDSLPLGGSRSIDFQVVDEFGLFSSMVSRSLTIVSENMPPTLDIIPDFSINEDSSPGIVNLTGIGNGGGVSQSFTITAQSDNSSLISDPKITFAGSGTTGTLAYQLKPDASGKATITVTVRNDRGANGGVSVLERKFVITVNPVNDSPTLNVIPDLTITEDAAAGTIKLSGIGAGGGESQSLMITAISDNSELIPNPTVKYVSPGATATLGYQPVPNASGKAKIIVTVRDTGGTFNGGVDLFTREFNITVNPVNDAPTLDKIEDRLILEDSDFRTVNLSGISVGGGESQRLTITATSDNPGLIPDPSVSYVDTQPVGTLGYQVKPDAFGTATITVTVRDDGGTANGGVDTVVRKFVITVNSVNDAPTFSGLKDIGLSKGASAFSLPGFATAISAGPSNESDQKLTFAVVADKRELFAVQPTISSDGTLSFTAAQGVKGSANVSVVLRDDGGRAFGGEDQSITKYFMITLGQNLPPVLANGQTLRVHYVADGSLNPPAFQVGTFGFVGVSDLDDDNVLGGVAVVGVDSNHGKWFYSVDGGATWGDLSTVSTTKARLLRDRDLLKFVPAKGFLGTAKLTYQAWDQSSESAGVEIDLTTPEASGQNSPFSVKSGTVDVRVAPVIYTQQEDARTAGRKLDSWSGVTIADADGAKAKRGVAIVGSGGNVAGHWEYLVGRAWKQLAGMSPGDATLLRSVDSVRFIPNANQSGEAYLLFRAWDQTTGVTGARVNTTIATGAASSFSADSDAFFFRVNPVNDRPVLDPRAVTALTTVRPGEINPAGDLVSTILGSGVTDADAGTVPGLAVTARGKIGGTWQYQLAGGSDWQSIPAVGPASALLLGPTDRIRFVPSGTAGSSSISFKAWDRSSGTSGERANSNAGTAFGRSVAKSTVMVTTVQPVLNSAPDFRSLSASFVPQSEDTKPSGTSVSSLLANTFADKDAAVLKGIAVTGKTGVGDGVWLYSTNGRSWYPIGDVSAEHALLLRDTDKVRFVSNPNFNGEVKLSYRAWDRTRGAAGQSANLALAGTTGGSSAFSTSEATAALTVIPVNDRPILKTLPVPTFHQLTPGETNPTGELVSFLLGSSLTDVDANSGRGIAITSASSPKGTWQYQLSGSAVWTNVPSLTKGSVFLLRESDRIRFVPASDFVGKVSLNYRGWDASIGKAGEEIALPKLNTSVSLGVVTAYQTVGTPNARPELKVIPNLNLPPIVTGSVAPPGVLVSTVLGASFFDANIGAAPGLAVTGADNKNGSWEYSLDGSNWVSFGVVSPSSAVLLTGKNQIRFVPKTGFMGTATISYKSWDQSDKANPGDKINAVKSKTVSVATQTAALTVNTAPTLTVS